MQRKCVNILKGISKNMTHNLACVRPHLMFLLDLNFKDDPSTITCPCRRPMMKHTPRKDTTLVMWCELESRGHCFHWPPLTPWWALIIRLISIFLCLRLSFGKEHTNDNSTLQSGRRVGLSNKIINVKLLWKISKFQIRLLTESSMLPAHCYKAWVSESRVGVRVECLSAWVKPNLIQVQNK